MSPSQSTSTWHLAVWLSLALAMVVASVAVGWCFVWRCILVKLPVVREIAGLDDSLHGRRTRKGM